MPLTVMTAVSKVHTLTANVASKVADANILRTNILITSTSGNIYIGGSDVTASNGFPVPFGETISIGVDGSQAAIWAIAGGAYNVNTLEFDPL